MNNFIINISKKQLLNLNRLITIYGRKYQKIEINSIVYLCERKRTEHNFNSDLNYPYCWNCAYKTWDINKKPSKYCIPLVTAKFEVIKINKQKWKRSNFIVLKPIIIFSIKKPLIEFKFKKINSKLFKVNS